MKKIIIIAEAGINHNGNLNRSLRLIDAAAYAGADYIKFQHTNPNLISPYARKANYQIEKFNKDKSQKKMIEKINFNWEKIYPILLKRCKIKKIKFLTSTFSVKDFLKIKRLKLEFIKIPSGEIVNLPLLKEISKSKKKILLSTGMSDVKEIKTAINILTKYNSKKRIFLMHCVSDYPTKNKDINLNTINFFKDKFKIQVGFSDHTLGIDAPILSVALGVKVIEKHFTLSKKLIGPDHKVSLNPLEFKNMVKKIRETEQILGKKKKIITKYEKKTKKLVRQSIHAIKEIKKGDKFSKKNISLMRPFNGKHPKYFQGLLGKKSIKSYYKYEPIK